MFLNTGKFALGNYPSKGDKGKRPLWFRDCDGNLLGIGQAVS